MPVIGRDLISDEVMASVKEPPCSVNRKEPNQPTNQDGNWGPLRHQYEATAAPTYYALMALPYRLGHHSGLTGAILAVRLATGVLGLLAVPLTWALARRLLPDHPAAWLIVPALLVATNVFAFGAVTNDPLGILLALGALLALGRSLEPDTPHAARRAALAGAVFGAGLAGKATILVITPEVIEMVVVWWMSARPSWRRAGTIAGIAGAAATDLVHRAYQRTVHDEALAPVIDQPWSDHVVPMTSIEVDAPCPVAAFEIRFASPAPPTVDIAAPVAAGISDAPSALLAIAERVSSSLPLYEAPAPDRTWYRLEQETAGRFVIALPPGSLVNASLTDRSPSLRMLPGPTGTPTMTLSCRRPGGRAVAFAASYPIHHPSVVTEAMVRGAPWAEAGAAALVTATIAALALRRRHF